MIRLHFIVEGQTEEGFVNQMLAPSLASNDIVCDARRVATGRKRGVTYRGGATGYSQIANDLTLWMKQDSKPDSWFTTMLDLYGLPSDFPGLGEHPPGASGTGRAIALESRLADDIAGRLGPTPVAQRLVPYIQVHEFEALLFSDPAAFDLCFPDQDISPAIGTIRSAHATPEDINDGAATAPSKRIARICRDYAKVADGVVIAGHIGLPAIRLACPHFNAWFERLLGLGHAPPARP